jgi:hypothetical protein
VGSLPRRATIISFPSFEGDRLCLHLCEAVDNPRWIVPTLTAWVHPDSKLHDLAQAGNVTVLSSCHAFTDNCEQLEVALLAGLQRVRMKVRDDGRQDGGETPHLPLERPVASVRPKTAAPEVLVYRHQDLSAVTVLANREAGSHLPSDQ